MDKKPLIGVSICAVVLLILASLSNVVGYQTVQSSNQTVIDNEVNQKELVFQTIVDIANNKEIQGILLRYQISRGEIPEVTTSVLTMKQLKQMYFIGLILSKTISKARIQSMIDMYQVNNQGVQKEINTVIEKDATLNREIKQLSDLRCDCENNNETYLWTFPVICTLLIPLFIFAVVICILLEVPITKAFLFQMLAIMLFFGSNLHCWWY